MANVNTNRALNDTSKRPPPKITIILIIITRKGQWACTAVQKCMFVWAMQTCMVVQVVQNNWNKRCTIVQLQVLLTDHYARSCKKYTTSHAFLQLFRCFRNFAQSCKIAQQAMLDLFFLDLHLIFIVLKLVLTDSRINIISYKMKKNSNKNSGN